MPTESTGTRRDETQRDSPRDCRGDLSRLVHGGQTKLTAEPFPCSAWDGWRARTIPMRTAFIYNVAGICHRSRNPLLVWHLLSPIIAAAALALS
jgi:hypothetical protein